MDTDSEQEETEGTETERLETRTWGMPATENLRGLRKVLWIVVRSGKPQIPIKSQYEKSQNSLDRSRNQMGAEMSGPRTRTGVVRSGRGGAAKPARAESCGPV